MTIEEKIEDFQAAFCPWGYRDIEVAIKNWEEAGWRSNDLPHKLVERAEELGMKIDEIDPVAEVYEMLYQEARTEIKAATRKDICNDDPYYHINVAGNYMCTSIDGTDENREALKKLIDGMEEKSKVVVWLYNNL